MKRIMIAAAALGMFTAGVAGAQPAPWNPGAFWRGAPDNPYQRIQFLRDRVDHGLADGSIDRREAARVDHELDGVRNWIHRMHWEDAGRLTPGQSAQVQGRLDGISRQIRWLRHNGW